MKRLNLILVLSFVLLTQTIFGSDPSSVTGLKSWLKADSLSLNDGDPVTSWGDSSGNGNSVGAVAGARPTFKTSILNGYPVARFSGSAQGLTSDNTLTLAQPDTIVVVGKTSSTATFGMFVCLGNAVQELRTEVTTGFASIYAGTLLSDSTNRSGAFHVFEGKINGASSAAYVDGTQVLTGNAGLGAPSGASWFVGRESSNGFDLTGDVAEVLIYDHALSSADRVIIDCYFKTKYGLTVADTCPITSGSNFFMLFSKQTYMTTPQLKYYPPNTPEPRQL